MMRCVPFLVAISAAVILVRMPPVPSLLPSAPAAALMLSSKFSTKFINLASAKMLGFLSYSPSISVKITSKSASISPATSALSVSLSPTFTPLIPSPTTGSFSLMTGMIFLASRERRTLRIFR